MRRGAGCQILSGPYFRDSYLPYSSYLFRQFNSEDLAMARSRAYSLVQQGVQMALETQDHWSYPLWLPTGPCLDKSWDETQGFPLGLTDWFM
jgi:hypothetical protein